MKIGGFITGSVIVLSSSACGPLLALVSTQLTTSSPLGSTWRFLRELTLLLWPAQVLGLMESSLGTTTAIAMAVAVNIALFGGLWITALTAAKRKAARIALLLLVSGAVSSCELWSAGNDLVFVNWPALALALLFYWALVELGFRRATSIHPT